MPGLTGPIDNTAHHRNFQRLINMGQSFLDTFRQFNQGDFSPATGRTGD